MKVIYAHTDSLYIPVDSIEQGQTLCETLNENVREIFPNVMGLEQHPVTLEFEKFYSALGVGATKNRNAGFISWKDNQYLREPEFIVTGFAAKKSTEIPIARAIQNSTLKMWAGQKSEQEIISYLKEQFNLIKGGKIDMLQLVKRSRLRRKLEDYETWAGGVAGVVYYNLFLNPDNPIEDSFISLKCNILEGPKFLPLPNGTRREAKYISVKELIEFDSRFEPDWEYYAHYCINKADPIFKAMDWNMSPIFFDPNQSSLEDW